MTRVVLLHGAWGAPTDWDDAIAAAGLPHAHRPDRIDISTIAEGIEVTEVWNRVVDRLAADLPPGPLVLGGYSLGGRLALALALHPLVAPRLLGLLVVAATAGLEGDDARAARRVVDDERAAWQARDPRGFLEAFWSLPLFAGLQLHPRRVALLDARVARASLAPARLARLMAGLSVGRMPPLWSSLSAIAAPTVIMSGERDVDAVATSRRLTSSIAGATHVVVEGAGHALLLEAPSAVGDALLRLVGEPP